MAFLIAATLSTACGDSTGASAVPGTARVLKGVSVPSSAASSVPLSAATSAAGEGETTYWALSPDQGRVTILEMGFRGPGGWEGAELTGCEPTYRRSTASLSRIVDCPFVVPAGTYTQIEIAVSTTFSVLIDDSEGGFYSDPGAPTGLSRAPPGGGADFVSFTVIQPANPDRLYMEIFLPTPLVVEDTAGAVVTVHVVVDMTHTVFARVDDGVARFITSSPEPAVFLAPFLDAPGRVEFYSATGTAATAQMPWQPDPDQGPANVEVESARVFYDDAGSAVYVYSAAPWLDASMEPGPGAAWNVAHTGASDDGFSAGGHLGLDDSGTLCWALPTDHTYTQWARLVSMDVPDAVGGSTTMRVEYTSEVPAPVTGDNYSSGCPAVAADRTQPLVLVAR